jgi:hypothetical protein
MARRLGYKKIEVKMDSTIIMLTINNNNVANVLRWGLTKKIIFLMSLDWNFNIKHIYREANQGADSGYIGQHWLLTWYWSFSLSPTAFSVGASVRK